MLAARLLENSRYTCPAWHRPARPLRWVAEVWEIHSHFSMLVLVRESKVFSLTLPVSTTYTMSGMVTPVSATLVASTIFLCPLGGC